ncbi:MAG TPA: hypothetical protein V6C46_08005 [Coleofasciculaceae cyanobacterium]
MGWNQKFLSILDSKFFWIGHRAISQTIGEQTFTGRETGVEARIAIASLAPPLA